MLVRAFYAALRPPYGKRVTQNSPREGGCMWSSSLVDPTTLPCGLEYRIYRLDVVEKWDLYSKAGMTARLKGSSNEAIPCVDSNDFVGCLCYELYHTLHSLSVARECLKVPGFGDLSLLRHFFQGDGFNGVQYRW